VNYVQFFRVGLAAVGLLFGALALAQTTPPTAPPVVPAPSAPVNPPVNPPAPAVQVQPVNVNTASQPELMRVPGLGATLADAIIKSRPYKDEADLVKRVKGIGKKNIVKFRPYFLYK
jgi:competence protein ComEA